MLDSPCRLTKKLLVALVRDAIASSMSFASIGLGRGTGRKFLASMLISGSNQGTRLHRVDNELVLAAVLRSTLPKMESKISSVSMLSLSSSSGCCEIMDPF
jgi:hypothetical protein